MADQNRNHIAIQIEEKLAKAEPLFTTECCIYRVPHEIRKFNNGAYTPKVVSIGPFHHGNPRLRNTESHKLICCKKFKERTETSLDNLVSCVQELEPKVRRCYSDSIKLSTKKLVELILVDCCFIFELFLTDYYSKKTDDDNDDDQDDDDDDDDDIPFEERLKGSIKSDLLLLENQLPFFVLEKLYNLALPSRQHPSFVDLTFEYFEECNRHNMKHTDSMKHFTDLLRIFFLPQLDGRPERSKDELITHLFSATELDEAGVKFRVKKEKSHLFDLKFSGRYLEIPKFSVEDDTESLFRNMMALEQCHYPSETYITDYVVVLDYLINTSKDVDVLVQNGIIINMLGDSSAVAKLFNGLCNSIVLTNCNSDYIRISEELNAYYKHPWNSAKATLRRDYCNTPWQMVASIAAIVLLVLTVIQTVCSMLQV
ncbi:UPF0481 protein At3g47200-like [Gastrolobium bilobum]|uniref:UPF0481 protein At3g47200-like n=1 Tax=Gastrolobium bilobum TaxID=150636 RepID=UPI002AAF9201|nr:UPF0481 protein At3g47200-like [Gastrolobium bilobum]